MLLICFILVGAVLKIASRVILPFTMAILLAFVMYPLIKFFEKHRIPRILSILLAVIIIVTGLSILGVVLYQAGSNILSMYSYYQYRLFDIYRYIASIFELPFDESLSFRENLWGQLGIRTWVLQFASSFSKIFINFLANALLVVFCMVFILLEASFFKVKLETAFKNNSERVSKMGHDLMSQVTRYLTAKFFISLANGVIFFIAFRLIGLDFAIGWSVIQFVMNFIPTLGSIVTGVGISVFALLQFWPNPGPVILIVVVILAVNIILGNILDPKLIGEHVGISPFMILVSLGLWSWLWGFAGMILAVPMTVVIKIVCENIPTLEPISVLIGSRRSVLATKAEQEKAEE
ncbi:MAG: AI-2E family transporter [Treponema sp.]|nr:AI-2E family transporter [Treponema sp.]